MSNSDNVGAGGRLTVLIEDDVDDDKGSYVKLTSQPIDSEPENQEPASSRCSIWYWVKLAVFLACVGFLAAVFILWVGPFLMQKVCFLSLSFYCVPLSSVVLEFIIHILGLGFVFLCIIR